MRWRMDSPAALLPRLGAGLAVVVVAFLAYRAYGWPGLALAAGGLVMWVLLNMTRMLKVLQRAVARHKISVSGATSESYDSKETRQAAHEIRSCLPSMSDRDGKIWMDGQMVDWRDAKIHVLTHTLHYGCGAFEGVRAYNTCGRHGHLPPGRAHRPPVQQRQDSAHENSVHQGQVNEAQKAVVRENKLESCYLRPLTWIGDKKLGVSPKGNTIHLMVAAWPWGAYLGEEGMKRGIRVKISSYTRHHVNITMTQAKAVSNYTNSILANMEATDDGYDEAMLLDASGFVSEGAGRKPVCGQGRRGLHARPVGRCPEWHHPQHGAAYLQGPGC
jgi:hypothetical protein